jgi:hypothetical protein
MFLSTRNIQDEFFYLRTNRSQKPIPPTMNPSMIMARPVWGSPENHVGATMNNNAPKIIRKNPPLFFGLLCSLCAILDVS